MHYKIERLVTLSLNKDELRLILNAMNAFYFSDGDHGERLAQLLREPYNEMINEETK